MLSEGLTDEQVQDGLAFSRLMEDEYQWPALQRLVARLQDDAIRVWQEDQTDQFSKKWLRGSREMAMNFLNAIQGLSEQACVQVTAQKEAEQLVKSRSDEGMGSGDLAL